MTFSVETQFDPCRERLSALFTLEVFCLGTMFYSIVGVESFPFVKSFPAKTTLLYVDIKRHGKKRQTKMSPCRAGYEIMMHIYWKSVTIEAKTGCVLFNFITRLIFNSFDSLGLSTYSVIIIIMISIFQMNQTL